MREQTKASLLLVLAMLFWALNFTLGKAVTRDIPPVALTVIRWALAAGVLLPLVRQDLLRHRPALCRRLPLLFSLGATGILGFSVLVYTSLRYTTVINSTLINSLGPAVVALSCFLVFRERLGGRQWLGIAGSLLGALLIVFQGDAERLRTLTFNPGDLLMVLAILLWGAYSVLLRCAGEEFPVRVLFFASILCALLLGAPLLVLESLLWAPPGWMAALGPLHYLSIAYFGFFPTVLAFLFYNRAIRQLGPTHTAVYLNLVVLFAAILAVVFLAEALVWFHLAGGALIVGGIFQTVRRPGN